MTEDTNLLAVRHTSATFIPASASLRIVTIWLSVNLLFFMVRCRWVPPQSSTFNLSHRKGGLQPLSALLFYSLAG
jgi:hypothetical protein